METNTKQKKSAGKNLVVAIGETYSMDYTTIVSWAQRVDGQWFSRRRVKDARFGYKNTAWRAEKNGPDRFQAVEESLAPRYRFPAADE